MAIYTSPRRLIAIVTDVAARTEALEEVFRGPAAKIAFDEAGNPTKAAIGFARGKGLDVDALERRDENGTEYVYAVRQVPSQDVAALLPEEMCIRDSFVLHPGLTLAVVPPQLDAPRTLTVSEVTERAENEALVFFEEVSDLSSAELLAGCELLAREEDIDASVLEEAEDVYKRQVRAVLAYRE